MVFFFGQQHFLKLILKKDERVKEGGGMLLLNNLQNSGETGEKTNIVSVRHWPLIIVFLVFFIVHDRSEKNKNRSFFIRGLVSVLNLMEENQKTNKYVNIRKI